MRIYLSSLVVMIGVFKLHMWGMDGAYTRIWWLDIASHTLVSFAIALCIGGLITSLSPSIHHKKLLIVALTFIIGFAWEGLEVYYNITGHPLWSYEYYFDTIKDLIDDTIGASIAAYITTRKGMKYKGGINESPLAVETIKINNQ
ncbi:MAG: hypothetical protein V4481_03350 [Patescibacteria group bacterium]